MRPSLSWPSHRSQSAKPRSRPLLPACRCGCALRECRSGVALQGTNLRGHPSAQDGFAGIESLGAPGGLRQCFKGGFPLRRAVGLQACFGSCSENAIQVYRNRRPNASDSFRASYPARSSAPWPAPAAAAARGLPASPTAAGTCPARRLYGRLRRCRHSGRCAARSRSSRGLRPSAGWPERTGG